MSETTMNGMNVITSVWLTESKEVDVPRSWRERWCSWPWRPWQTRKLVMLDVPSRNVIRLNQNTLVMHPVALAELKRLAPPDAKT